MAEPLTPAQQLVCTELERFLEPGSAWRAGVLVLTYKKPEDGERDCNIAHAIGMQSKDAALDVVILIRRLRGIADELEAIVMGAQPLPQQPDGRGS